MSCSVLRLYKRTWANCLSMSLDDWYYWYQETKTISSLKEQWSEHHGKYRINSFTLWRIPHVSKLILDQCWWRVGRVKLRKIYMRGQCFLCRVESELAWPIFFAISSSLLFMIGENRMDVITRFFFWVRITWTFQVLKTVSSPQ